MKEDTGCMKWLGLSGINVSVDNDDYPLQIKVASLPNARLQVYFLENEDFFKRKQIFHDDEENWFEDNILRTVFFCKGALETVKKFGWPPGYYPLQWLDDGPDPGLYKNSL
jgi:starch synthase